MYFITQLFKGNTGIIPENLPDYTRSYPNTPTPITRILYPNKHPPMNR